MVCKFAPVVYHATVNRFKLGTQNLFGSQAGSGSNRLVVICLTVDFGYSHSGGRIAFAGWTDF